MFPARHVHHLKVKLLEKHHPSSEMATEILQVFEGHQRVVVNHQFEVESVEVR